MYGYPKDPAVRIAVRVMREFERDFDEIIACCFSAADKTLYDRLLAGACTQG